MHDTNSWKPRRGRDGVGLLRRLSILLLFALTSSAFSQVAPQAPLSPRIGVVTMAPGIEYWARFGHNAIVVEDATSGARLSYNYGYFDFDQPGFFSRFLRGKMLYRLVVLPLDDDLQEYAEDGRGAQLQWLNLTPEQARAIADFLEWNAHPENAEYHYDYFTDNCSTRVRDVLDRALNGALEGQLSGRSRGLTYRSESLRLGAGVPWLYFGMHAGLAAYADKPLSIWDEGFVPQRLTDALTSAKASDGTALVSERVELLPERLGLERAATPDMRWPFTLTGLGLALILLFLLRESATVLQRRGGTLVAGGLWLLCGLGGVIFIGLWAFTSHVAAYGNENLLLFNPLSLALLSALPALARNTAVSPLLRRIAMIIVSGAVLALFLRFLPFRVQNNGDFVVLFGPIHAALLWRLARRTP